VSKIKFFFENVPPFKVDRELLDKHVQYLIGNEGREMGEISIVFCTDTYLLGMNKKYLKHAYYTDIITFDYVENSIISGDLFISIERVKENASRFKVTFEVELYRVIFHGILHLIGYDDKTTEEKALIRDKEDFYLSLI
jgi:probable rRNA maturation factor